MKSFSVNVVRYALLAVVAVSLGTWAWRTWGSFNGTSAELPGDGVVVINFHGAVRCDTCKEIEKEASAVLANEFGDALKSGQLVWRVIDFEKPENRHFIEEYGLVSSTVVATRREGGRDIDWSRLDDVWVHVFDVPAMTEYLRSEINKVTSSDNQL